MDPLYELAAKLLQLLYPEWGGVHRRGSGARHGAGLARLLPRGVQKEGLQTADITLPPPPGSRERAETLRQAVRHIAEAHKQQTEGATSIHVRRIAVTRLLYSEPALAIAATRFVDAYPRYYEELAHDLVEQAEAKEHLRTAIAASDRRLEGLDLGVTLDWTATGVADRLVVDYHFASAAADELEMAKPFSLVLCNELAEIQSSRIAREPAAASTPAAAPAARYDPSHSTDPLLSRSSALDRAHALQLVGLAISGGGIRSATFGLGVLQALASLDLLRRFDYLSTVSGGGYIGSWLMAWIKRLNGGVNEVQQRLDPARAALPTEGDARPIRMLREYSNYLTPAAGLFSVDTWTMIAVWLRNTILNQLVLIAFIGAALLVPWLLLVAGADRTPSGWAFDRSVPIVWTQLILAVLLLVAVSIIGMALRDFDDLGEGVKGAAAKSLGWSDSGIAGIVGSALLAGAWIAAFVIVAVIGGYWEIAPWLRAPARPDLVSSWLSHEEWEVAIATAPLLLIGLWIIQGVGQYAHCFLNRSGAFGAEKKVSLRQRLWVHARLAVWAPPAAAAGALLVVFSARVAPALWRLLDRNDVLMYQLVFLPPLVMESLALTVILHIGLLGRLLPDDRREWWSRLGAHQLRFAAAWSIVCAIGLLAPGWLIGWAGSGKWMSALTWVATTLAGVLAAKTPETGDSRKRSFRTVVLEQLARLAPAVFVLGLLVVVSVGVNWLLEPEHFWEVFGTLVATAAVGLLLSWRVDINEFSMHHFYKNRLVRCYLGASRDRESRRPNRFTGFDSHDDVKLADLWTGAAAKPGTEPKKYVGPYPIINTALNLTKGSELAWQERKAESFVFTPLVCGYELADNRTVDDRRLRRAGYRPTTKFAYSGGPHVGTAVAISGAAASPNMGYHSSPAVAFLLTMFNVRLGWWVGNPRYSSLTEWPKSPWRKSSPTIGAIYLLKELFGRADNRSQYVNLTDGGHFENLGIYELVRRRCTFIVAIDAEEDGDAAMGGLAGVIRKCRIDFDVHIDIDIKNLTPDAESRAHCAIGRISYPEQRASGPDGRGWLLYLKSSLTGDESPDIREYAAREPAFPHESTGDQWFNESQFESYRTLGYHVASDALRAAAEPRNGLAPALADVFQYLNEMWAPIGVAPDDLRRHLAMYQKLYDRAAEASDAAADVIDPVLFPMMREPPPALPRDAMYLPTAAVELMHSVFCDLQLDRFSDQPHRNGWIGIFRMWSRSPEFKTAWNRVRNSYSSRFRQFVDRL